MTADDLDAVRIVQFRRTKSRYDVDDLCGVGNSRRWENDGFVKLYVHPSIASPGIALEF